MIVYSKERKKKKKKVGKFRKEKKNKTQVVLGSAVLQVSHWNLSRSDDVVTFFPCYDLSVLVWFFCVSIYIL